MESSEMESSDIDIAGVDAEKGLSLYYGEMDIYLQALQSYAVNVPATIDKIRSVSKETLGDYAIYLHGIKGTSANIGAEKTRTAALELELLAKNGDISGVLAKNENFIKETEAIVAGIKAWLEQYNVNI